MGHETASFATMAMINDHKFLVTVSPWVDDERYSETAHP